MILLYVCRNVKEIDIILLAAMNIKNKLYGNLAITFLANAAQTKVWVSGKFWSVNGSKKVKESPKSFRFVFWGPQKKSKANLMAIWFVILNGLARYVEYKARVFSVTKVTLS